MKNKIALLLVFSLALCMFVLPAFATQENLPTNEPITEEVSDSEITETETTEETDTTTDQEIVEKIAVEPITVSADNSIKITSVKVDAKTIQNALSIAKDGVEYPIVIDLTSAGVGVESVIIPTVVLETIIGEETLEIVLPEEEDDSEAETSEPVDTKVETEPAEPHNIPEEPKQEVAEEKVECYLKVLLVDKECVWSTESLEGIDLSEDTVELSIKSATNTIMKEHEDRGPQIGFKPADGKKCGILFVSQDAEGTWNVTSQNMFGSNAVYVFAIIILVVLTFVVILAVDLILIKIYRMGK